MELRVYSKSNVENIDIVKDVMRQSLSSITQEIQKFHFYNDAYPQNDIFEIIKKCKSDLKLKNKRMKKLSENIEISCILAKTVISAKEKESKSMKDLVETLQNESTILFQNNQKLQAVVKELSKENTMLFNKIDSLHNLIKLGYENVQNICNEPVENLTLFTKFQNIIVRFGQYYADFHNEHEKCKHMEQKTRFYQNKLKILEVNFKILSNELKSLRYQNMKLERQKDYDKQKDFISTAQTRFYKNKSTFQKNLQIVNKLERRESTPKHFDLSSHLNLVKNLLSDQYSMIQNLSQLSEELCFFES